MPSNLRLYAKAKELVAELELYDEQGKVMTMIDLIKCLELMNKIFALVERRRA